MEEKRPWWVKIALYVWAISIIYWLLNLVIRWVISQGNLNWTGFFGKTLWDWLQLLAALAVPVVVGFGVAWFTAKRAQSEREITLENQREAALQEYINKMSELLLEKNLRESREDDEVRKIARLQTLTVLSRLGNNRKVFV